MIVAKDTWNTFSEPQKAQAVTACLDELHKIEHKQHPLSSTPEQGKLRSRKLELEKFVIDILNWEDN